MVIIGGFAGMLFGVGFLVVGIREDIVAARFVSRKGTQAAVCGWVACAGFLEDRGGDDDIMDGGVFQEVNLGGWGWVGRAKR